ncbi:MAG: hypothetical protein ACLQBD_17410 [Syntrophobacteraceae bacterium]
MKRQAYGFRDSEYFKLRPYDLHNQGFSLTPSTHFQDEPKIGDITAP